MQPPDMVNPNQPIAWLTRLFTFLPDMAHALVSRTVIAGSLSCIPPRVPAMIVWTGRANP